MKSWLFDVMTGFLYALQAVRSQVRRLVGQAGVRKVGYLTIEFFREDLNGFGGFGRSVKNVTDHYNARKNGWTIDVLLSRPQRDRAFVKRCHNADVLFRYKDQGSLRRNLWHYGRYLACVSSRRLDLLLAVEYFKTYEAFLRLLPSIPLVIWLRDPRPAADWDAIATVSLVEVEDVRTRRSRYVEEPRASLHRILRLSQGLKRPVLFAHNAEDLVPKARELYALPSLTSSFLPNPIEMPQQRIAKAAEPTVGFLGRLDPVKRPWIFCELARRLPHVRFLVAGRTHCADTMHRLLQGYERLPNLQFLGLLDGQEKDRFLQASWLVVNTSVHEALPVSFLEAFAARTPVVSCQNPDGLAERFGRSVGPVLGDGLDERSLGVFEEAIADLLVSEDERRQKGERARRYVEEVHSFERFEHRLANMVDGR